MEFDNIQEPKSSKEIMDRLEDMGGDHGFLSIPV